jgi:hypothetical protein
MSDDRIWEKQGHESATAFDAFKLYREDIRMTIAQVSKTVYGKEYSSHVARWCTEYNWVDRREAYWGHLDKLRVAAREKAVKDAEDVLADSLKSLMNKAVDLALKGDSRLLKDLLDRADVRFNKDVDDQVNVNVSISDLLGPSVQTLGHDED